ncbi:MAG: hypothetical protein HYX82_02255, partial [Chloroflexi bacterium]|nr:hypothetical protein [Chloroflexota bacterium]
MRSKRYSLSSRILPGVVVAILILSVVTLLPPAGAVAVNILNFPDGLQVQQSGAPRTFELRVEINAGERVPIKEVRVILDNAKVIKYAPQGTQIVPPGGVFDQSIPNLQLISPTTSALFNPTPEGYGYSYGALYGYGFTFGYGSGTNTAPADFGFAGPFTLRYNVTIFPAQLAPGPHNIRIDVSTDLSPNNTFSSQTINFAVAGGGFQGGLGPDFIITLPSNAFSMPPNSNRSRALTVSSVNNFAGNIALSFFAPPDLTAKFDGQTTKTISLSAGQQVNVLFNLTASSFAPPGFKSASIKAANSTKEKILDVQVNVAISGVASLIASPPNVPAGGTITFNAFGFTPNSPMTLQLLLPTGLQTITPTSFANNNPNVASDGTWGATLTIPSNAPTGQFMVQVTDNSAKMASVPVNVVGTGNDYLMTVSPGFLDIPPGQTGQAQVSITSINSFASPVSLSVQGAPPGLTVNLTPSSVTPPQGGSAPPAQISVQVGEGTPPGDYFISIKAESTNPPITKFQGFNIHI